MPNHKRWYVIVLAALLLSACGPFGGADDAGPDQPACGDLITEKLTLEADLNCADGIALTIGGDGVMLDLGGHTISGPGPGQRTWPIPEFDVVGVYVQGKHATVTNGTIRAFGTSVLVRNTADATLTGLSTVGSYYGIYLYQTSDNTLRDNAVEENTYGLTLFESNANEVTGNSLARQTHHSPGGYGIYLTRSTENLIERNDIEGNINWGLWFTDSSGNTVVRNNVIGNDPQVSDDTGGNQWYDDETREGNFWDDYTGPDADGDGIGDVPYFIGGPGRSADIYPFVNASGWDERSGSTVVRPTPTQEDPGPPIAYVPLENGNIAVVDPVQQSVIDSWPLDITDGDLGISLDGRLLYAISGEGAETEILQVDTANGKVLERFATPDATNLAPTYDDKKLIVSGTNGTTEIDLASGKQRSQPGGKNAVAIMPSWKHNVVLTVTPSDLALHLLYLPNQNAPYTMPLGATPLQALDNRTGTLIYVLLKGQKQIELIETEHFQLVNEISLGGILSTDARIAPSRDGSSLYVLDRTTAKVQQLDLQNNEVLTQTVVGGAPRSIAISGDGNFVLVTSSTASGGAVNLYTPELELLTTIPLPAKPIGLAMPR